MSAMRPLFADPRTDCVFMRIFGTEENRPLLVALLNDLLELDEAHRVVEVELLSGEQRPKVQALKYAIVDARCVDARGTPYVVKVQILNVKGFDTRLVDNVAMTYCNPHCKEENSPRLNDIVGVTICDFELWPRQEPPHVPMLSRWRMQEQYGEDQGLGRIQLVFLELPKCDTTHPPRTAVERWAYLLREARHLKAVPEELVEWPYKAALEAARVADFTVDEWDEYIREGMAIQDKRGALALARKQGRQEALQEREQRGIQQAASGMRAALHEFLRQRGLPLSPAEQARLESCEDLDTLRRWLVQALAAPSAAEALR